MIRLRFLLMVAVVLVMRVAGQAEALSVTQTLGAQDFNDGDTVFSGPFLAAGAGEPAPFDGVFIGSDPTGPNFSGSWTFNYAAISTTILSASITIGILDHDSMATGNQVGSFDVDGQDLTSLLNTQFEGHGGANSEYDIYTVTIPGSAFSVLTDGSATFSLTLQGPGLGILGETQFNGAALDFSTLNIEAQAPPSTSVPEPFGFVLVLTGIGGLIGYVRRRR